MGIIKRKNGQSEIDLIAMSKLLLCKSWMIIISALVFGVASLTFTYLFIEPEYTVSISMYVNNTDNTYDVYNITSSDISASIMLIQTYSTIIKSETMMDQIIEMSGVDYSVEELSEMIEAGSVENTEVLLVSVTDKNPKEAALIANSIAEIVPNQLTGIVAGSSVKVLNSAKVPEKRSSPSYSRAAILGVIFGGFLSAAAVVLQAVLDTRIKSGDDLKEWDYPVLGTIPVSVLGSAHSELRNMKRRR